MGKLVTYEPHVDARAYYKNTVYVKLEDNVQIRLPVTGIPAPTIKWCNETGEPLAESTKINSVLEKTDEGLVAVLNICEAQRSYAGIYMAKAVNSVGEKTLKMNVIVMDRPSEPMGRDECYNDVEAESLMLDWSPPKEDGGSPVTHYVVNKLDKTLGVWSEVSSFVIRSGMKVGKLVNGHVYKFKIQAVNKYDISEPMITPDVLAQHPFSTPSKCEQPEVIHITNEYATLKWTKPNDGGSPILGYHIEKKDRNALQWQRANNSIVRETTFKAGNLTAGLSYTFRVIAVNAAGCSNPSKATDEIITRDPIEPPREVETVKVRSKSIKLCWRRPEYDGGAKLTGYMVEYRDCTEVDEEGNQSGRFLKANFNKILGQDIEIEGLIPNHHYEFRVNAINASTCVSSWSSTLGPILAHDELESPVVTMDPAIMNGIVAKAREDIKIVCEISGKPIPQVEWFKNSELMVSNLKTEIKTDDYGSTLIINDASRFDSAEYQCRASSVAGSRNVFVKVHVHDSPGPITGPIGISGITATKCLLNYGPSAHNGGAKITGYRVEKRETSRLSWLVVYDFTQDCCVKINALVRNNEYVFRVAAINQNGMGPYMESAPMIARDPYTKPSEPGVPSVDNIIKDSLTLCWARPIDNGGAEIRGYIVERRKKGATRWIRVLKKTKIAKAPVKDAKKRKESVSPAQPLTEDDMLITDLRFKCSNLEANSEQEFRVYAVNKAGNSEPSGSTGIIRLQDPLPPPSPPGQCKMIDHTATSVTLKWSKPLHDGGADINGYQVDFLEYDAKLAEEEDYDEEEFWKIAIDSKRLRDTQATITGLQAIPYKFRVRGCNIVGASTPCPCLDETGQDVLVTPSDKLEAPVFGECPEVGRTIILRSMMPVRVRLPYYGRPVPSLKWEFKKVNTDEDW